MGEILRTIRAAAVEVTATAFYGLAQIATTVGDVLTGEEDTPNTMVTEAESWSASLRRDYHDSDTDQLGTCDFADCYWCWVNGNGAGVTADDEAADE